EQGAASSLKPEVGSGRNQKRGYQSSQPKTVSYKANNKVFRGGPRSVIDPGTAYNASKPRSYAGALMGQHGSVKTAGVTKAAAVGKEAFTAGASEYNTEWFLWQVCAPFPLLAISLAAVFGAGCFTGCSRCSLAVGLFTLQLEVSAGRVLAAQCDDEAERRRWVLGGGRCVRVASTSWLSRSNWLVNYLFYFGCGVGSS
ncbi:hypothetical protein Ancab_015189, partial [Ancistrocladus abbreviatus]